LTSVARYAALAGLVTIVVGCEAIVNGDVPAYTCSMEPFVDPGKNTCPAGQYCKGSGCTACEDRDICDGYDNDCDGVIDDGTYSDHDGDGYTFCGVVDAQSGTLTKLDCIDDDPTVHPGAKEVCNGKDDDCNGITDDPGVACPSDQTCIPKTGKCIGSASVCTPQTCPSPNVCDPDTNGCGPPNQGTGASCTGDTSCTSGICGDPSILGVGFPGQVCTQPCCSSFDCGAGFVCLGPGTGGNYCVAAQKVGRPAPGGAAAGASCATGSDCRSAVCNGGQCEDVCCVDANCGGGTACSATTFAGSPTFACIPPPGGTPALGDCRTNADCTSGICVGYQDGFGNTYQKCISSCCSSRACGKVSLAFGGSAQLVCSDDQVTSAATGVVPQCDQPKQGNGTGNVGDSCQRNGDCFSDRCDTTHHACTDTCCLDADCGRAGFVCRPTQVGSGTYLRCVPIR
jgi:hypothetical protein